MESQIHGCGLWVRARAGDGWGGSCCWSAHCSLVQPVPWWGKRRVPRGEEGGGRGCRTCHGACRVIILDPIPIHKNRLLMQPKIRICSRVVTSYQTHARIPVGEPKHQEPKGRARHESATTCTCSHLTQRVDFFRLVYSAPPFPVRGLHDWERGFGSCSAETRVCSFVMRSARTTPINTRTTRTTVHTNTQTHKRHDKHTNIQHTSATLDAGRHAHTQKQTHVDNHEAQDMRHEHT